MALRHLHSASTDVPRLLYVRQQLGVAEWVPRDDDPTRKRWLDAAPVDTSSLREMRAIRLTLTRGQQHAEPSSCIKWSLGFSISSGLDVSTDPTTQLAPNPLLS